MTQTKYYSSFNLIRIVVALFIACIAHYSMMFLSLELGLMSIIMELTYVGVEIFFFMSGFLAYRSYRDKIVKKEVTFISFMLGRIKRLYPLMILSVVVMAASQWISFYRFGHYAILDYTDGRNSVKAFVLSVLGLNSGWICNHDTLSINGATWYISILIICYLIFYFVCKIANNKKKNEVCLLISLIVLGSFLLAMNIDKPLLFQSNGRGYMDFFGGAIFSIILAEIEKSNKQRLCLVLSLILFFFGFAIAITRQDLIRNYSYSFVINPGLFGMLTSVEWINKVSNSKVIKFLGKHSYGIYLFNLPTLSIVSFFNYWFKFRMDYSKIWCWFLVSCLNIVIAVFMGRMVDSIKVFLNDK